MPVPGQIRAPPAELVRNASPAARVLLPEEAGRKVLPIAPNFRFDLVHYPNHEGNWFVAEIEPDREQYPEHGQGGDKDDPDAGLHWLPLLQPLRAKPGLCGFRTVKRGAQKVVAGENAHLAVERRGGVRLRSEDFHFLQPFDCEEPGTGRTGTYYAEVWDTPRQVLIGRRQTFDTDRQRRYRWLLWLMREGVIAPPLPEVIDIHRRRKVKRVTRRSGIVGLAPEVRDAHVAEARAQLARVTEAQVPERAERTPRRPPPKRTKTKET